MPTLCSLVDCECTGTYRGWQGLISQEKSSSYKKNISSEDQYSKWDCRESVISSQSLGYFKQGWKREVR